MWLVDYPTVPFSTVSLAVCPSQVGVVLLSRQPCIEHYAQMLPVCCFAAILLPCRF